MNPERLRQIEQLYHAALQRGATERAAYLDEACAGDDALRHEVESLLAHERDAAGFLSTPAAVLAAQVNADSGVPFVGRRLGVYHVLAPLGAGGMGEVYRARDTKLGRDVAIKILPELFANDPDRLRRFEREAHVLASLNHPNIAAIYGLEESGSVKALVLELVEGQTLAERLRRPSGRPVPCDEALAIARQIVAALEAAHEKGIIHRDLKPANVAFTADGQVKVLDFGLAKVMEPALHSDASDSSTLTVAATQAGVILGTAAYMSPEQAKGDVADKRSDVWAFGCILFELLAGKRAFEGDGVGDTLAAVLRGEPDWSALPADVPATIRALIARCLEKDRRARIPEISVVRFLMEDAENHSNLGHSQHLADPVNPVVRALPWAVAGALGVGLAALLVLWAPWQKAPPSAPLRLSAELGVDASLEPDVGSAVVLSPDGQALAFVARKTTSGAPQLYIRRLDQVQATLLSGTDGARQPFFSPDGQWIAFFADRKLKKIAVTGSAASTLADAPDARGGTWADDGTIAFTPDSRPGTSLSRISSAGGKPEPLTTLDPGEVTHRWPQKLPAAKGVLFTAHSNVLGFDEANLVVQALPGGARTIVHRGGYYGRYLPSGTQSGHLVYVNGGTLFAVPFDLDRLEVTGESVPVVENVSVSSDFGSGQFAVSDGGTLAYLPSGGDAVPVHWIGRDGKPTLLRATPADWGNPRFAPDGDRLALDIFDGKQRDVWVYDWPRDALSRLTADPAEDVTPVWTADGRRIVFASMRDGPAPNLYWQRADGTGEVQRLTDSKNKQYPGSWHPGGRFLAFFEWNPQVDSDVMTLPMAGDEASGWKPGTPTVFLKTSFSELEPMFSPDGRWLAYSSNESGRFEVYVRPFPGPGSKWQISTGGGSDQTWSASRRELFFGTQDGRIMVVRYTADGDSFGAEKPQLWSEARYRARPSNWNVDLHPDGERFALEAASELQTSVKHDKVMLIFNFFDELRRIAPTRK